MISMFFVMHFLFAAAGDPATCPMHAQHMAEAAAAGGTAASGDASHGHDVDMRHDALTGFSHEVSRHSFRLFATGGAIELHADHADDAKTIAAIRTHLRSVAMSFEAADYSNSLFVHGHAGDGLDTMKRMKSDIHYRFEEVPDGARVLIVTTNPEALGAVHQFLKFQVVEHRTGNSGVVENE